MLRSKKFLTLLLVLALCLAAAPLLLTPAQATERWKAATLAPKQIGWSQQFQTTVMPYIKDSTDDYLRLKVYWGGVMGNDEEYLAKMRIGQLQAAGLTAAGSNSACPELVVLGLPFLFNNYEEVDYIRTVMWPTFDYYFQENGYKLWMWFDQDFDQIYSSKWEMNKLEDFKKARFQSWYGPLEVAMIKALGGNAIEMPPTEAPAGYRTGVIDANFSPAVYMVGSQMYTQVKYMNPMKIRYCPAVVIPTLKAWNELPAVYQQRLEAERPAMTQRFNTAIRKDNERCIEGMIKYGIEKVDVTPENRAAIEAKLRTVYKEMAGKLYPTDLLLEVQRDLAAYRKGRGRTAPAPVVAVKKTPKPVVVAKAPEPPKVVEAPKVEEPKKMAEPARPEPPAPPKMEEPKMVAKAEPVKPETPAMAEPETKEEATADLAAIADAYKGSIEAQKEADKKIAAAPKKPEKPAKKRMSAWEKRFRLVWAVQEKLKPMGYYNFKIDGIFGPITHKGILDYQKDRGLPVTGAIDKALLESLGVNMEP